LWSRALEAVDAYAEEGKGRWAYGRAGCKPAAAEGLGGEDLVTGHDEDALKRKASMYCTAEVMGVLRSY
jgi:hypothetical protein